jgi:hypothetical protein
MRTAKIGSRAIVADGKEKKKRESVCHLPVLPRGSSYLVGWQTGAPSIRLSLRDRRSLKIWQKTQTKEENTHQAYSGILV